MSARFFIWKSKISIEFWMVLFLFMMGALLRLYRLEGPHLPGLWVDTMSADTRILVNQSFLDMIRHLMHLQFPPLYYVILNLWVKAFGNSEWVLKLPSAIFSSLTIIVIYKLGKELFGKNVGLISALLLVFSPFAIDYAHNAKMYALFWLLTAGSFLFFFRFIKDQKAGSGILYTLVSILCCYTMYTGFLLLAAQNVIFLLFGEKAYRRKWFLVQMIIILCLSPWVISFLCSTHEPFRLRAWDSAFNYFTFFLNALSSIIGGSHDGFGKVMCCLYIFLITYLLIDVLAVFYENKTITNFPLMKYFSLLIWVIIPVLIYFIFDYVLIRAHLADRYIGFLQFPLILLASSQIDRFHGIVQKALLGAMVVVAMGNTYIWFNHYLMLS